MLTDIRYAIKQLAPLASQDRVRRALDALERVASELEAREDNSNLWDESDYQQPLEGA